MSRTRLPPWPYPFWIAHRGAGKLAPENTLAAFRLGASLGWRAFECDVKLSADGVPFLLHDATLERTSSGHGTAGDLPWSTLSQLDAGSWHGPRWAGEPLAMLDGVAAFIQANGYALNIEIKPTPGADERTGEGVARAVRALWGSVPAQEGSDAAGTLAFAERPVPLLSSFRPAALAAAREAAPELPRALLVDEHREGWIDEACALECRAAVTNWKMMSAEVAARLHERGLRALVYTVNEPDIARQMIDAGVDGIITDAVDRFAPAIEPAARRLLP